MTIRGLNSLAVQQIHQMVLSSKPTGLIGFTNRKMVQVQLIQCTCDTLEQ